MGRFRPGLANRFLLVATAGVLAVASCTTLSSSGQSEKTPVQATVTVPATEGAAVTDAVEQSPSVDTATQDHHGQFSGFLPDGTGYRVIAEPEFRSDVQGISAAVVLDDASIGGLPVIGLTTFVRTGSDTGVTVGDGTVLASSGGWTMRIALYEEVKATLASLSTDPEQFIADRIDPLPGGSVPRFTLSAPLRWANDIELPLAMEVIHGDVVVRRGCTELRVACSNRHGVQVVPFSAGWDDNRLVWIESDAPRPGDNAFWLDRGPLEPRGGHQVVWVGERMIVWGGSRTDSPASLVDGAAFDPADDSWKLLAPSPFNEPAVTVAVAADERMIVIATAGTFAYLPGTDSWDRIGDGLSPGRPFWTGNETVMANTSGVFRFDEGTGKWIELPGAPQVSIDLWFGGSLGHINNDIYLNQGCGEFARWDGSEWQDLPPIPPEITSQSEYRFCPAANQWTVIDESIIVWEDEKLPSVRFDATVGVWDEIASIPVPGTEGAGGAVVIDGQVLAMAGGIAIYDPGSDSWQQVELPGSAFAPDMVWTGTELLMWGGTCCYGSGDRRFTIDAWRWAPPIGSTSLDTATLACTNPIDILETPPAGYVTVANVLALPETSSYQRGRYDDQGERKFSKFGLMIRAGSVFSIMVAEESQPNALLAWGTNSRTPAATIEIPGCPGKCEQEDQPGCPLGATGEWIVYPGGVWTTEAACVEIEITTEETVTHQLPVGTECT